MKIKYLMINVYVGFLIWSVIHPNDLFTCFLEILPAIVGFIILVLTYKKFKFTNLTYLLILLHCIILFIGGHYTYAEVPLFDLIKEYFHQSRNNYDKLGHLAQGLVPAMINREIFIKKNIIGNKSYFNFIIISICIAISAAYEWIEWWVSIALNDKGDAFLGTQGYLWDTQSDMLCAAIGAILGLALLSKKQDKEINIID